MVGRLRWACGWEQLYVTEWVLVLGIAGRLRLTCGKEWLCVAKEELKERRSKKGRTRRAF